jgi:hypothetical protein
LKDVLLQLDDLVHDALGQFSKDRGLGVPDTIRWLLGDFVANNLPQAYRSSGMISGPGRATRAVGVPIASMANAPVGIPSSTDMALEQMANVTKIFIAENIKKNDIKCPHCQQPATPDGLYKNECEKCQKPFI